MLTSVNVDMKYFFGKGQWLFLMISTDFIDQSGFRVLSSLEKNMFNIMFLTLWKSFNYRVLL